MPAFDPATRRETRIYQEMFTERGRKVYKELAYAYVEYDGDPARYLEPLPPSDFINVLDGSGDPIDPRVDGCGAIVGIEYVTARPFDWFSYNDVDENNIGTFPPLGPNQPQP